MDSSRFLNFGRVRTESVHYKFMWSNCLFAITRSFPFRVVFSKFSQASRVMFEGFVSQLSH